MQQELADTPAEVVIANHAIGLFQLAALHLSRQPPDLVEGRLAIDAMAGSSRGWPAGWARRSRRSATAWPSCSWPSSSSPTGRRGRPRRAPARGSGRGVGHRPAGSPRAWSSPRCPRPCPTPTGPSPSTTCPATTPSTSRTSPWPRSWSGPAGSQPRPRPTRRPRSWPGGVQRRGHRSPAPHRSRARTPPGPPLTGQAGTVCSPAASQRPRWPATTSKATTVPTSIVRDAVGDRGAVEEVLGPVLARTVP